MNVGVNEDAENGAKGDVQAGEDEKEGAGAGEDVNAGGNVRAVVEEADGEPTVVGDGVAAAAAAVVVAVGRPSQPGRSHR